jgi:GrpB-like predicted nucleotidyltransferase (UPF0157 family)
LQSKRRVSFIITRKRSLRFCRTLRCITSGPPRSPGLLTKGDVDLLVRIDPARFAEADLALAQSYERNTGSIRNSVFASFHVTEEVGVQLVSKGSDMNFFLGFRDALLQSADLRAAYNELKQRHAEESNDDYRQAKDRFIAEVLAASR